MINGIYFQNYRGRKIIRIETDGELFTVIFNDGEVLKGLDINALNHVIVTATGR